MISVYIICGIYLFRFTVAVLEHFKLSSKTKIQTGSEEKWLTQWDPEGYKGQFGHFLMPLHCETILTVR